MSLVNAIGPPQEPGVPASPVPLVPLALATWTSGYELLFVFSAPCHRIKVSAAGSSICVRNTVTDPNFLRCDAKVGQVSLVPSGCFLQGARIRESGFEPGPLSIPIAALL